MFEEEVSRPMKTALVEQISLGDFSIADLGDYVAALEREIIRVRLTIQQKSAARGAADGFFKTDK